MLFYFIFIELLPCTKSKWNIQKDGVGEANNITNYGGKTRLINEFSSKPSGIKVYIILNPKSHELNTLYTLDLSVVKLSGAKGPVPTYYRLGRRHRHELYINTAKPANFL